MVRPFASLCASVCQPQRRRQVRCEFYASLGLCPLIERQTRDPSQPRVVFSRHVGGITAWVQTRVSCRRGLRLTRSVRTTQQLATDVVRAMQQLGRANVKDATRPPMPAPALTVCHDAASRGFAVTGDHARQRFLRNRTRPANPRPPSRQGVPAARQSTSGAVNRNTPRPWLRRAALDEPTRLRSCPPNAAPAPALLCQRIPNAIRAHLHARNRVAPNRSTAR